MSDEYKQTLLLLLHFIDVSIVFNIYILTIVIFFNYQKEMNEIYIE